MVDTLASGASAARCVGSSPILGKFVIVSDAHFFIITKPCILLVNPYTLDNLFYVMTSLDMLSAEYKILTKTIDEPSRDLIFFYLMKLSLIDRLTPQNCTFVKSLANRSQFFR